ncbi:class I SAM-dependent methyltransferase [Leptospira gomenensis]|uniref:Class I SAM-dependent methyltransferase n=1 Tax=Leptospira gomenensis TaxID=2484974 RepID=A0A5F1Y8U7_9LEPT|nr:class I SAM-dependent methyltransferase [Leptospira gomenensis]TGK30909.1 class I SAM-dependent methyltransferase [Leptospira gomenensis]TGK32547.1 class I SAM-dependent methyltransferase [Leptospira gomenensis]TGK45371.1 class I SAM-dependent methyltransferase [Leptospira gomenensis]TGK60637.1 class I SAM-dependent methyltransferase [Leptospira gomenensis]
MSQFGKYSEYYDLLYKDKNYELEVSYVDSLIKSYKADSKSVLELGCGTGKHALLLTQKGYEVTGVDISPQMLAEAERRKAETGSGVFPKFVQGDVRTVRVSSRFDVVLSLFHVMSYQTSNKDILAAFETASLHSNSGSIFIFDVWYGPAVLSQIPETRIKRLFDEKIHVTRLAESKVIHEKNIVEVDYEVWIRRKNTNSLELIQEKHPMRYFFNPELELLLAQNGFEILRSEEWLTGKDPGTGTWGVVFVVRKNDSLTS